MKTPFSRFFFSVLLILAFTLPGTICPLIAEPFAVRYSLEGVLQIEKSGISLTTDDGRVFDLLLDSKKAKPFDGKIVSIEGKAHKADDIETIKVQEIKIAPRQDGPAPIVEHADYQRPPSIKEMGPDKIVINDLRWDIRQDPATSTVHAKHSWETVTILPEKVERAYFILKPFAPKFLAAHSLFAFTFQPGGMVSSSGKESKSLAVSIEAYKKVGQKYGLVQCMKKVFDIVWNLVTYENYLTLNVKFNTSSDVELIIYPMKLTREQTKGLLVETIKQSCVNRKGEYYHTILNNCTNNLVILLNRVLPVDQQIKLWKIPSVLYNLKTTMPLSLAKLLKKQGLMGEPLPVVNKKNFIRDIEAWK